MRVRLRKCNLTVNCSKTNPRSVLTKAGHNGRISICKVLKPIRHVNVNNFRAEYVEPAEIKLRMELFLGWDFNGRN